MLFSQRHNQMMSVTYKALDKVDYSLEGCCSLFDCDHSLGFGDERNIIKKNDTKTPKSLLEIAAANVVKDENLLEKGVKVIPCHLNYVLLKSALQNSKYLAVSSIVSEWPMETLNFRSVFPEAKLDLFVETLEADTALFMALMRREDVGNSVKLKCLDLRGFHLNEVFCRVLIGAFPLLALKKDDQDVDKLTEKLKQFLNERCQTDTGGWKINELEDEIRQKIKCKLKQLSSGHIYIPPGDSLVVKMDRLEFGLEPMKYLEYALMEAINCLTSCRVEVNNLSIDANMLGKDDVLESSASYLALIAQRAEILQGLSINNMEEELLFKNIFGRLFDFTKLQALDLGSCKVNISGKTRVRAVLKSRVISLFQTLTYLTRLDLRNWEIAGHLPELLEAVCNPLEYLNVNGCALCLEDLKYLSNCKHTKSLKELHVSSLVHTASQEQIESPEPILDILDQFTDTLVVLQIQNNELKNEHAAKLCSLLSKFKKLKILDTLYNFLGQDALLNLVQCATLCRSLHCIAINLLPIFGEDDLAVMQRREAFQKKCEAIIKKQNRPDLAMIVVAIAIE